MGTAVGKRRRRHRFTVTQVECDKSKRSAGRAFYRCTLLGAFSLARLTRCPLCPDCDQVLHRSAMSRWAKSRHPSIEKSHSGDEGREWSVEGYLERPMRPGHIQPGGGENPHHSFSSSAASAIVIRSPYWGPMICTPIGRPVGVTARGAIVAGNK